MRRFINVSTFYKKKLQPTGDSDFFDNSSVKNTQGNQKVRPRFISLSLFLSSRSSTANVRLSNAPTDLITTALRCANNRARRREIAYNDRRASPREEICVASQRQCPTICALRCIRVGTFINRRITISWPAYRDALARHTSRHKSPLTE